MDHTIKILLIEDNPGDAELLEVMLGQVKGASFTVECANRLQAGLARLSDGGFDVVLLDLSLPDSQGLETFRRVKARASTVPIVVMSGTGDESLAIKAVQESAQDYLVKGQVNSQVLARGLRYALERKQAELAQRRAAEAEHRARLELQEAHEELKKTQSQLVQSAKLASLGQLVAGVAHEINNPLAYVGTNMVVLERDLQALRELIQLFQQAEPVLAQHRPDLLEAIHASAEDMDLPYTLTNLAGLVQRSREGLKRIQQIVHDLRGFARSSEFGDLQKGVDMNASIASTLNIVRGQANNQKVNLVFEPGPVPPMQCYPGKINQVILNLTANALDACATGGTVTVRTAATAAGLTIQVADNGAGIDPAVRDKIFDPFFTTKPLGKGTGLGLSISHGIVKDHGGSIEVDSTPGAGSCFTVFLPVQPPICPP